MKIIAALGIGTTVYILYRLKVIDDALSMAQSVAPGRTDAPVEYDSVADNYMSPENVYKLINGTHEQYEEPGQYGVTQTTVRSVNGTKIPTFGYNYSKLFT